MSTRSDEAVDAMRLDDATGPIPIANVPAVDATPTLGTTAPPAPEAVPVADGRPALSWTAVTAIVALVSVCLLAVWFIAYAFALSAVQEQRSQRQLYGDFRGYLDASSAVASPIGGVIEPGTPVALLETRDGTFDDLVVVEGTSPGDLAAGPGHLRNSPLPGQPGTSVVMGRSVTSGAPFRSAAALRVGTIVTVTTGQGVFSYKVDGVRRAGDKLPVPVAPNASRLTLVTSEGNGWRSVVAPGETVWVDATLQGSTVVAPQGRPIGVPAAELPNHGDPSAWLVLVLWLQALVLAGVGFTWAWYRWGRWQTYVVGTPVVVAVLWGASATAMRLLPNLL